jgi:hypothetical protein
MDFSVLFEVCSLAERSPALAREGSLLCVDPKMVKEIVPFAEVKSAKIIRTALKDLDSAVRSRVLVLIYEEIAGLGDLLRVDPEIREIEVSAINQLDSHSRLDLTFDRHILNL